MPKPSWPKKFTYAAATSAVKAILVAGLAGVVWNGPACAQNSPPKPQTSGALANVEHIIVIYLENRSFDNLYGLFPGANGIADAGQAGVQVDKNGKPYEKLPPVMNTNLKPPAVDARFPQDLPNKPFEASVYAGLEQTTGDLVHRFYQEQLQINGGQMNKFVAWSDAGALALSYYDGKRLPMWEYAKKYVLMDNFFHAAFGGSFLNHMWLVCACTPVYPDAPASMRVALDAEGGVQKDGAITSDGYVVNTAFARGGPFPRQVTDPNFLVPPQDAPHIGDRLDAKGVSWAWYSGGWNDAVAGRPTSNFQFHHQPFAYFRNMTVGGAKATEHLKDEKDLLEGIVKGDLPQVVFFKPNGSNNEHPGYATVEAGDRQTAELIKMIERSSLWNKSLIIVTYDENGGYWDHVAPPKADRWGPGSRVPTILISPLAKKGFIDHTPYDTTSILKLIETRYDLAPLTDRDANAKDMTEALDSTEPHPAQSK